VVQRAEIHAPVENDLLDIRRTEKIENGLEGSERQLGHIDDIGLGVGRHAAEEDDGQSATGSAKVLSLTVKNEGRGGFKSDSSSLTLCGSIAKDHSLDHHLVC